MDPLSTGVSTLSVLYKDIDRLQSQAEDTTISISSGLKYQSYKGFAKQGDTERLLNLQSRLSSLSVYKSNNTRAVARIKVMENSLAQLQEVAKSFTSTLAQRLGPLASGVPLEQDANFALDQISNLLNVTFEGRYLFGGAKTDTPPVQDIKYSTYTGSGVTDAYYRGDTVNLSVRVSETQEVSYGIGANEEAFRNLIGAIHQALEGQKDGNATSSHETISAALDRMNTAVAQLASLQTQVGNSRLQVEAADAANEDIRLLMQGNLNELQQTDIVEATSRMSELEAQIQASFIAWTRLSQLRLSDFLS